MAIGADLRLDVFGQVFFKADGRGRRRPLRNAELVLTAYEDKQGTLTRSPNVLTNPMGVTTDGEGRFKRRIFWDLPGVVPPKAMDEPVAFDVVIVDGAANAIGVADRVFSNGEDMVILTDMDPDDRPLATAMSHNFTEVTELAGFLASGLATPSKLGQVNLSRPFLSSTDKTSFTAPEKLFRHFGTLLDRLQAAHLDSRRQSPGHDRNNEDLMVPLGWEPLEKQIQATLYWHNNLSAADRVAKLVGSFATDVTEDVIRRNVSRLVAMLGKILKMPIEYQMNSYLWEDMAVILTLFTGIGLVAQRNRIVWADFTANDDGREIVLSMV